MYYEKLEQTDKLIEDILKWRDEQMKVISKITNSFIELALKQLGETIPQEVKEAKRGRRNDNSTDNS